MVNNQVKVRIPQVLKSFTDGKLEVSIDADRISTLTHPAHCKWAGCLKDSPAL